jgi:hypothetical protein
VDRQPRPRIHWEAIFHGSQREVSTVIIGCEADFWKAKRMSREEAAKIIQGLKDYTNLSYESEATIAADVGVSWDALKGWLRGKSKPTFKSLLKSGSFWNVSRRQEEGLRRLGIGR